LFGLSPIYVILRVVHAVEEMRSWKLFYAERPWTLNTERTWHYQKRARKVKEWRDSFALLCLEQRIPNLSAIYVHARPILSDWRIQDVAACFPAVKAAIDGIVDAGVILDDNPKFLRAICFYAPKVVKKKNGLELIVSEVR